MARRPVFISTERRPYAAEWYVDFVFNPGFAVSQKQKNILALHEAFQEEFPGKRVLEISSKSLQPEGVALSAFNLMKYVPSLGRSVPVENVFQGGKVFADGGPYTDLLEKSAREAKRDERIRSGGELIAFEFEGEQYPVKPRTIFYDFIYMNALMENEELAQALMKYDAFTDIEFNPNRSVNCQAHTAAKFVSLAKAGLLDRIRSFEEFLQLFSGR